MDPIKAQALVFLCVLLVATVAVTWVSERAAVRRWDRDEEV